MTLDDVLKNIPPEGARMSDLTGVLGPLPTQIRTFLAEGRTKLLIRTEGKAANMRYFRVVQVEVPVEVPVEPPMEPPMEPPVDVPPVEPPPMEPALYLDRLEEPPPQKELQEETKISPFKKGLAKKGSTKAFGGKNKEEEPKDTLSDQKWLVPSRESRTLVENQINPEKYTFSDRDPETFGDIHNFILNNYSTRCPTPANILAQTRNLLEGSSWSGVELANALTDLAQWGYLVVRKIGREHQFGEQVDLT